MVADNVRSICSEGFVAWAQWKKRETLPCSCRIRTVRSTINKSTNIINLVSSRSFAPTTITYIDLHYFSPIFPIVTMQFAINKIVMLALFAITVSGASKFADTCQNVESSGSMIRAECQEHENGQLQMSQLDLNRCIKNSKGSLKVRSWKPKLLGLWLTIGKHVSVVKSELTVYNWYNCR